MDKMKKVPLDEFIWPDDVSDIPKEVYSRPDLFERELEEFFYGPYWHPVAHQSELPQTGDFKTIDLGRVPLLVARGKDETVRVFINSCSHRGTTVETAPCGNRKQFQCPYHRWNFADDGRLIGAPGSDDFSPKFCKEDYGLKQLKTQELYGLIYVTLSDEAPDLVDWLGEVVPILEKQIGHKAGLKFLGYQKVRYSANWKAYMDNEAYHAPLLHTGFRLLGWLSGGGEQVCMRNAHTGMVSQLKPSSSPQALKDPSLIEFKDGEWDAGSCVIAAFPVTIIVKHLDIINIRYAIPRAVDCTEVHYAYFARADDSEEMILHRVRQSSNLLGPCGMISMEDAAIFLRAQVGNNSPGFMTFQKGVKDLYSFPTMGKQNDEVSKVVIWDHYRRALGFKRKGEVK